MKLGNSPIYIIDPYKAAIPIMINFIQQNFDLVRWRNDDFKECFVRELVETLNYNLSWTILGRDIFNCKGENNEKF